MLRSIGTFKKRFFLKGPKTKHYFVFCNVIRAEKLILSVTVSGVCTRGLRPPALTPAGFSAASQPPIYVC